MSFVLSDDTLSISTTGGIVTQKVRVKPNAKKSARTKPKR